MKCFYFEESYFSFKKDPLQADALILVISVKTRYISDQTRPHFRISKETRHATQISNPSPQQILLKACPWGGGGML